MQHFKNVFLLSLVIGAGYSAFDTMALTTKAMRDMNSVAEKSSFNGGVGEDANCIQYIDEIDSDGEVVEVCKPLIKGEKDGE